MKSLLMLLAVLLGSASALAQDEAQTFNAFAVVTAQGTIVPSGEKQSTLTAAVKGPFFVETSEGPVDAGTVICTASLRLEGETRRQAGTGICTFTAPDGATARGEWQCEGYELVGCRGRLKLSAGTGRLQDVAGEGAMTWRPSVRDLSRRSDGSAEVAASGILIWREFTLTKK